MDVAIDNQTMATVALLNEIFGYDVVVCGDSMTADVYCGDHFLYRIAIA